ncbi:MAG: lactate dehydrogenase [Pseudomonadota bacterium]
MDIAIIGAAGTCGRQLAVQLVEGRFMLPDARLQLVGHRGGASEHELWAIRADIKDAFVDDAPEIELAFEPEEVNADIVVMLAGATVPSDPSKPFDRARLGRDNRRMFEGYANALAQRAGQMPIVIVQSNPVELGVHVFAEQLGRHRVVGAGGWLDTMRFRGEIAAELGVSRLQVHGYMLGQHGMHLVPTWSQLQVKGVDQAAIAALVDRTRSGRPMSVFPEEISREMGRLKELIEGGDIKAAFDFVMSLPVDLRTAIKPFFIHYTSGRTSEVAPSYAVADMVAHFIRGESRIFPAQVALDGEWLDLDGVISVPVLIGLDGWESVYPLDLADDEITALKTACQSVQDAIVGTDR